MSEKCICHLNGYKLKDGQVASAGYGYAAVNLGSTSDDSVFVAKLNEQLALCVNKSRRVRFVMDGVTYMGTIWSATSGYGTLTANSYSNSSASLYTKVVRNCTNGNWQPWEYENPTLSNSKEYRTTERYAGKPVYVKRINYGALGTANTTASIPLNVDSVTNLVGFTIISKIGNNYWSFPIFDLYNANPRLTGYFEPDNRTFVLQCHIDMSDANVVLIAKYTKD